jgi:hypothetical protein
MVRRDEKARSRLLALPICLALLQASPILAGGGPVRLDLVRPDGASAIERSVRDAVRDAKAKLASASCLQVFSDFRDASGRTAQENLDRLGRSASAHLESILFYNGHGYSRCDDSNTIASTSPGSQVVYICSPQFLEKRHSDSGLAADLLIHEELHSLGLGENPPASKEITARVIARCGK